MGWLSPFDVFRRKKRESTRVPVLPRFDPLGDGISLLEYQDHIESLKMSDSIDDEMKLAYFAGFIDGEGCICCGFNDFPMLKVSHTYRYILEELQGFFGGSIKPHFDPSHKRPAWIWRIGSDVARDALILLLPFLKEKRRQAEIALEILSTKGVRGKKVKPEIREIRDKLIKELRDEKLPF